MADRYSMLLIERAVVGLLRLCLIVAEKVIVVHYLVYSTDLKNLDSPPCETSCMLRWMR